MSNLWFKLFYSYFIIGGISLLLLIVVEKSTNPPFGELIQIIIGGIACAFGVWLSMMDQ
jgi:hypothetical protein